MFTTTAQQFFEQNATRFAQAAKAAGMKGVIEFDIDGKGGGAWVVDLGKSEVRPTTPGKTKPVAAIVRAQAGDFMALVEGRMSPQDGIMTERLRVAGDVALLGRLLSSLSAR